MCRNMASLMALVVDDSDGTAHFVGSSWERQSGRVGGGDLGFSAAAQSTFEADHQ